MCVAGERGACMGGVCMAGDMHGWAPTCQPYGGVVCILLECCLLPPANAVWGKVMFLHLFLSFCSWRWVSASGFRGCTPPWTPNTPRHITRVRWPLKQARRILLECILVTIRNSSCGKVMYSQASVILSTGKDVYIPPGRHPPQADTPTGQTIPRQTPSWADTL